MKKASHNSTVIYIFISMLVLVLFRNMFVFRTLGVSVATILYLKSRN